LPLLLMVSVVVISHISDEVSTSPNARLPDSPMMRVGVKVPVPETVVVLVPLVASLVTVSVLL